MRAPALAVAGSSRLAGGVSVPCATTEAPLTLASAQSTIAGLSAVSATLKKPPKIKIAAPMAAMIASAPIRARKRIEPSPSAVGRRSTRARPTPSPADARQIAQPQHPPGRGCGSSPEQGDAFGDRRLLEVAIKRRQGQRLALSEFQISCVVNGEFSLAGESHQDRLISRSLESNGQQREITKERVRHGFGDAVSPLACEEGVADLIVEETWSERLDARDRVERGFDAWIGFLVEEPCSQNRRIDH